MAANMEASIFSMFIMFNMHVRAWGLGQMTNNWINLDPIEIIQFCLKIYDL